MDTVALQVPVLEENATPTQQKPFPDFFLALREYLDQGSFTRCESMSMPYRL